MSKKSKKNAKIALIYIRYLLPVALCLLLVASTLIPCLSYSTIEGTQKEISAAELMQNSWDQVRAYLFATADTEVTQERFSWTVIILLPVLTALFVVGIVSTVVTAVMALLYINNVEFRKSIERIRFITVIPNRVVACLLQILVFPLLFYSRLIIPLYDKIMHVDVLLNTSFPEPWVWGIAVIAVTVIMSVISANFEKELGIDPFKKIITPVISGDSSEADEKGSEISEPVFKTEAERRYYENQKKAREEQAELIRKLLNKNDEKEK